MCISPITIKNKTKYISYENGMQHEIEVECGRCSECREAKTNEYILRTMYQAEETLLKGGYMYFDTLTYDNEHLPRLSQFIETESYNRGCFKYEDIRYFYERLRSLFSKEQEKEIKFFITAEFGSLKGRPHYHVLLFITTNIHFIDLSEAVGKAWKFGRTDGKPYKTTRYIKEHNLINTLNLDAFRYIAKYVNKSIEFNDMLSKKWYELEKIYKLKGYDKQRIKKIRQTFFRHLQPFHRQSQGYGIYAIEAIGIETITRENKMWYRTNTQQIYRNVQIRPYYKRKLYQEQIEVDGKKIWIYNERGMQWKKQQEENNIQLIENRLQELNATKNVTDEKTLKRIAEYLYLYRGRNKRPNYEPSYITATQYNYNTDKDEKYLGKKIVSRTFAGNDKIGYCTTNIEQDQIKEDEIYYNQEYEDILNQLTTNKDIEDAEKTRLIEHLIQTHKEIFR